MRLLAGKTCTIGVGWHGNGKWGDTSRIKSIATLLEVSLYFKLMHIVKRAADAFGEGHQTRHLCT